MNELQFTYLFDVAHTVVVLGSISLLVFGKSGIWSVGHASFLFSGGIFVLLLEYFSAPIAFLLTFCIAMTLAIGLGHAASRMKDDHFIVVSLATVYMADAFFRSLFNEGVTGVFPRLHGIFDYVILITIFFLTGFLLAYSKMLDRTRVAVLLRMHKESQLLSSGVMMDPRPGRFWIFVLSIVPIVLVSVLDVVATGAYSPNDHTVSRCLLYFGIMFAFGINSIMGVVLGALFLATLQRAVETLSVYGADLGVVNNIFAYTHAGNVTELLLGILLIIISGKNLGGMFGESRKWIRGR